ncbi:MULTISPECIES: oligosaccharide flippase family protein [Kordiimonas]|jgi:O-antigen/teichoic acid export membrane protein|uniref:oligosaccharide flippase family protein n=1 Tax=Kordiimonas TaxID=288021 RepID=UPI00257C6943|nr:oligosaccharide flippase family protein [Kordiimonas sp. UBA4487]
MGLGRSLYFSGLSSVVKLGIQFGLSIFVARMLTPEEIGSFGVALAAAAFVRAFESAGVENFVASYKALDKLLMRSVFTVNMLLNLLLAVVLWLLSEPLGAFFGADIIADITRLTALATALNTHVPIMRGLMRRDMRFRAFMAIDSGLMVVSAITTIAAVLYGYGALALAMALVAEKIVSILVGLTLFRGNIPVSPRLDGARIIIRYGLSLSTATVIGMIGNHANNFILGKLLGLAPSAQFDRGYTLPRLISQVAQMSFHNVLVPEIARQHKAGNPCEPVVQDVVHIYATLLWPAGLVLAIVAPEVVLTLFGYQWSEAASIASYLVIYGLLTSPVTLACSALVALGHGGALIRNQLADNGTKVAVLMTALFFDLRTVAILMILPVVAYLLTACAQLHRLKLISPGAFARALKGPLRITLVCALPAFCFRLYAGDGHLSLVALLLLASASAIVYGLSLRIWEPAMITKITDTIRGQKPAT